MTITDKYSQVTAKGAQEAINYLHGLDDDITIGNLRSFLEKRVIDANKQFKEEKERIIKELTGKCFRIVFSPKHTVLMKIKSVNVIEKFGSPEGLINGEIITKYEKHVEYSVLTDESDRCYSNYFPNEKCEEFDTKEFNALKKTFKGVFDSLNK